MVTLTAKLSPLVFAELYSTLASNPKYEATLSDLLGSIGLPYEWLEQASEAYSAKWNHDLEYFTPEGSGNFALESQHSEFATWLLSGLHFSGTPDQLSGDLQAAVIERVLTEVPSLALPLPPELSPVIVGWTLGSIIANAGHRYPISPALLPESENARAAFAGLAEHYLVLQSMEQPWPEMMCTSLYWRGYGIAEALRPDFSTGAEALKQLRLEAYHSTPVSVRDSLGRHLDNFGTRRNALSHIADSEGRPRFVDVLPIARSTEDLELTINAMSQFVFQEVAKEVRERPPRVVRANAWEGLNRELQTEW